MVVVVGVRSETSGGTSCGMCGQATDQDDTTGSYSYQGTAEQCYIQGNKETSTRTSSEGRSSRAFACRVRVFIAGVTYGCLGGIGVALSGLISEIYRM